MTAIMVASTVGAATPKTGANRSNLDESVAPGADFYQYACGGWQKANPLKPEYSRYGSFDVLGENNLKQLHDLVEGLRSQKHQSGSIAQKIGDLYSMGMDSVRLNNEGANPIKADLAKINKAGRDDFSSIIAWMQEFSAPFFGTFVMGDLKDSSMNILYWGQAGMGLGDRDYYLLNDAQTLKIREAYKKYIAEMCLISGYTQADADRVVASVMDIETELAEVAMSRTEQRDLAAQYNMYTSAQLSEACPAIDWSGYYRSLYLPEVSELCVMQPKSLQKVNDLLLTKDEQTIRDYLSFHLMDAAAGYLSDDFRTASFNVSKVVTGAEQDKPRWKRALGAPNHYLGEALGQLYVEKYFPESSKQQMLTLVGNLRSALSEHIANLTWMSDATKAKAQEKLATMTVKVGYPDKWKDYTDVVVDPKKSYWENIKAAMLFQVKDNNEKCGKPVDRSKWEMTPQTVNAYYEPSINEICFPAGILQAPFFSPDALDADNYGAIGVVIGHEMTHGFDDNGRQFNKDGNMIDWWTADDSSKFNELADKLVAQFDDIIVLGDQHANGRLTLGENIADQGGLRVAYTAYHKTEEAKESKSVDGFTPDQRFYLSYANVWAGNIRDAEIIRRTKIDEHSLGKWRVNATLRNLAPFYKAFGIGENDAMYMAPEKRVIIW